MPSREGEGCASDRRALRLCASVSCDEVDYINAHGTLTQANDLLESAAIETVFGEARVGFRYRPPKVRRGTVLVLRAVSRQCIRCSPFITALFRQRRIWKLRIHNAGWITRRTSRGNDACVMGIQFQRLWWTQCLPFVQEFPVGVGPSFDWSVS